MIQPVMRCMAPIPALMVKFYRSDQRLVAIRRLGHHARPMDDAAPTPANSSRLTPSDLLLAVGIALFYFIATAPTLRWMEFSSGSENLVVATTLELLRPNELPTSNTNV